MDDDVIVMSFKFSIYKINVHISNSIEPTNFILGTNIQQHEIYTMIKVQVTLTKTEGHR